MSHSVGKFIPPTTSVPPYCWVGRNRIAKNMKIISIRFALYILSWFLLVQHGWWWWLVCVGGTTALHFRYRGCCKTGSYPFALAISRFLLVAPLVLPLHGASEHGTSGWWCKIHKLTLYQFSTWCTMGRMWSEISRHDAALLFFGVFLSWGFHFLFGVIQKMLSQEHLSLFFEWGVWICYCA